MTRSRDEFSPSVKELLAKRVSYRCSNPECRQPTSGPQEDPRKSLNVGVAAHISAAAEGGPRFDTRLSSEERRDSENGIWLCQTCAKLIDSDLSRYTVGKLRTWKREAERLALKDIEAPRRSSIRGRYARGWSAAGRPLRSSTENKFVALVRDLDSSAMELLTEASGSPSGTIVFREAIGVSLQAGAKVFSIGDNAKEVARYKHGLRQLERARLIERQKPGGNVWSVTHEGYSVAEHLSTAASAYAITLAKRPRIQMRGAVGGGPALCRLELQNAGEPFRLVSTEMISPASGSAEPRHKGQICEGQKISVQLVGMPPKLTEPVRVRLRFEDARGMGGETDLVYDAERNEYHQEGMGQ